MGATGEGMEGKGNTCSPAQKCRRGLLLLLKLSAQVREAAIMEMEEKRCQFSRVRA